METEMKDIQIVTGAMFGDEGKGSLVNHLVKDSFIQGHKPLVIRFSGGPQAGHTVVQDNKRHVFSTFGSGTLSGADTLYSQFCLFEPGAFLAERQALLELGISLPIINIDNECNVITPYDRLYNQNDFVNLGNGTCGVGVGATMKRIETTPYVLKVRDFYAPKWVLDHKLTQINKYYIGIHGFVSTALNKEIDLFYHYIDVFTKLYPDGYYDLLDYNDYIFEGSQGILLDREIGLFPHVTYANTTSKNVWNFIKLYNIEDYNITQYFVSRCYLTRHGTGPMGDTMPVTLINNEQETNKSNKYQGDFRTSAFDIDLYRWAISQDNFGGVNEEIQVITCMDQLETIPVKFKEYSDPLPMTHKEVKQLFPDNTLFSYSPEFKTQ